MFGGGLYMRITPLDIQQKQFPMKFRGFDVEEVYAFLEVITGGDGGTSQGKCEPQGKYTEDGESRSRNTRTWRLPCGRPL